MKLIMAFIQPFKVDDVRDSLRAAGVTGMSISNVQGFGRQSGQSETYRGYEYAVDFVPKICLQVLVHDAVLPSAVTAIETSARTGTIGDGKIAIIPVEDVIRIRTGERGPDAL
jgi:nitrogen regulatory protein P-II 1